MQGIEISRSYYLEHGLPMLREQFGPELDRIAAGLAGEGSQCLGYDDEISRDHDFEPGFCLWITRADWERFGFRLERAYARLPREYLGLRRGLLNPAGGNRLGVITIEDFYTRFLGSPTAPGSWQQWLGIPATSLASAVSGQVFADPLGAFSGVREQLLQGYPQDILRKKLAAHVALMAQAGQYNYPRCLARGEPGAAQLAIFEFVKHCISAIFLLNNRYEPFYKWAYRALGELPLLGHIGDALQSLTELDNSPANAELKQLILADTAALLIAQLQSQGLSRATCQDLQNHALSIQDGIRDSQVRNLHLLEGA